MSNILKASLWMTGAILSFTSMAIAGRAVSLDLDTFEIMMYRSLIGIVIVLSVSHILGTRRQIERSNLGLPRSLPRCHRHQAQHGKILPGRKGNPGTHAGIDTSCRTDFDRRSVP